MTNKLYTRPFAAEIVYLFEKLLDEHGIIIPSPEDSDGRFDYVNFAPIYGTTYSDLADEIERILVNMLRHYDTETEIISFVYD